MSLATARTPRPGTDPRPRPRPHSRSGVPVSQVPRAAVWAAYAIPLCALPSGLWRIALVAGWPDWYAPHAWQPWERPYVLSLSLVAECLALLSLALVKPWGERVPGWVPRLGGRAVPAGVAVVPAATGAFLATAFCAYVVLNHFFAFVPPLNDTGETFPTSGPGAWALWICYAPLLAWGPLLAYLTRAYWLRRRAATTGAARTTTPA
ncbi:hypothetical protein ACFVGY_08295 [Streptomyces sp. NPDC127106]|uniref:hypothetical protein n=1 Tax=Streptomyces sp. NPDC127106 TaxID=3345360 RepID=UPI0036253352